MLYNFLALLYAFITAYCIKLQANFIRIPLEFLLGFIWISLGFNGMHDASHYALFYTPRYNNYASMLWNSFSLWKHSMWLYHHVFYHHSFTNTINDSDIYHIMPLFRKHQSEARMVTTVSISLVCLYNTKSIVWSSSDVYVFRNVVGYCFRQSIACS